MRTAFVRPVALPALVVPDWRVRIAAWWPMGLSSRSIGGGGPGRPARGDGAHRAGRGWRVDAYGGGLVETRGGLSEREDSVAVRVTDGATDDHLTRSTEHGARSNA
ncbi:hypothetical protein GCM10023324_68030 [Streptomyces youssoufiensis]